jgi:predicted ester cyclase
MRSATDIIRAYWTAANDRDWDTFTQLLADDVVYEGPQTRERVRGSANYLRFNVDGFPGDWHLRIVEMVGEGRHAASWIDFTNADGTNQPGLCFFELGPNGKISRITDFWPDPYELPAQRAHLVERY